MHEYKKMIPEKQENGAFPRYNSMKRILLYLLAIITTATAYAADTTKVHLKGRVTDENNTPVSLCLIKVEGQNAGTTAALR